MTTFQDTIKKMLVERGMFDDQAEEVIQRVIAGKANECMQVRPMSVCRVAGRMT